MNISVIRFKKKLMGKKRLVMGKVPDGHCSDGCNT